MPAYEPDGTMICFFGVNDPRVTPEEWERTTGLKIPSLVWANLDGGLRPIQVESAVAGWVGVDHAL